MSKINVSECKHVAIDFCTKLYVCKNTDNYDYCANYENCYYKQLQQLKLENEELKQKLEKIKDLVNLTLTDDLQDRFLEIIES